MPHWEYRTLESLHHGMSLQWASTVDAKLNELGAEGWELVSVIQTESRSTSFIFKRPRQETEENTQETRVG